MKFEVLGEIRLRSEGRTVELAGHMQRTLVGLLLASANRPVSVDSLTDALWGAGPDERAEAKLQLHVHRLRRKLTERDRLTFGPAGYQLTVRPDELDAERFESLVDEASRLAAHDPPRCIELIRQALDLWRGTPYDGFDVPQLSAEAQRLSDRRLAAIEALYEAELAIGRDAVVVVDLTDLVRQYPLRERLRGLLMAALYRGGRRSDALQVYQDARRTLVDELGLEPGVELRTIERAILADEPVTFGPTAQARMVPAQLPTRIRGFVGREAELAELDARLTEVTDSAGVVALAGTAGVGKTALAVAWAHRIRDRYPDGQLYVDLRGYGSETPLAPDQALSGFLRALGVDGAAIPADLDERAARFRSMLDGRRMLLVLDNARTVDQVRPLLPGTPSCVVVVTSRDSLNGLHAREGAHRVVVDRMSVAEGELLMRGLLGDLGSEDPASIGRLIEQCARLPLALRIAADLVTTRPSRGVAGLVAELTDERYRLDLLDIEDSRLAIRAVFSWSYQMLSTETARLFRMCGLHPGHDFDAYALAALADVELRAARRSLDTLVRAQLVDETSSGRFQPHDLLRAYARELAQASDDESERRTALTRLCDGYLRSAAIAMDLVVPVETQRQPAVATEPRATPTFGDDDGARAWLDAERANLLAIVARDPDAYAITMSDLLWRYLDEIGDHIDDAITLHTSALDVARRRGERAAEAEALRHLGNLFRYRGQDQTSTRYIEQALEIYVELDEPNKQAATLNSLGGICDVGGRLRDAVRHFEAALAIHREQGRPTLFGPLINLANAQGRLGNYEVAFELARQAEARAAESSNRALRAHSLCSLARLSEQSGKLSDALEYAQRLLTIARDGGVRAYEDEALNILGDVHRGLGDHASSLRCHLGAVEISRRRSNTSTLAEALLGAGLVRRLTGDTDRAVRDLEESRQLAVDSGYGYEEARALSALGDAYDDLGRPDEAHEHWQRAAARHRELDVPGVEEIEAKLADCDRVRGS